MKRILLFSLILLMTATAAGAQRDDQRLVRRTNAPKARNCSQAYIGFSSGINNPVGLIGLQIDIAVSPSVSIGSGVGLSSWGAKTFIEARYYFKPCNRGWAIGSGFTYNTGANDVEMPDVETIYGDRDIIVDQHSQANFMLSGYHFFSLGRSGRNRFHLQAGFSIPLSDKQFISNYPLTEDGKDQVAILAPGGLILGIGFSFGAGRM